MWERLQHSANAPLYADDLARLKTLVTYATGKGMTVAIETQNFATYFGNTVGVAPVTNAVFADFWSKMAMQFKDNPHVMFDLMNEPHDLPTEQWGHAAQAAITAIRATGATNTILVPGNGWDGAWNWTADWYGTPNSTVMLTLTDPGNNMVFEVHQYLDSDGSGSQNNCVSATIGSERLQAFTGWLRANGKKGFVGEFGAPNTSTCHAAVTDMVSYMEANRDVLIGWSWWSGGPWWGSYPLSLSPNNGVESPQLAWLKPTLSCK